MPKGGRESMTAEQYYCRIMQTLHYGEVLRRGRLITAEESIFYVFERLNRLLSMKLMGRVGEE